MLIGCLQEPDMDATSEIPEFASAAEPVNLMKFALGVVGTVQIFRGNANLGIDIAGGTSIQVKFRTAVHLDRIREIMGAAGHGEAPGPLAHR